MGPAYVLLSQDISPWPMFLVRQRNHIRGSIAHHGRRCLVFSPAEKHALYLGTQYVLKTTDGGLHWQKISPDLDRSDRTWLRRRLRER